MSSIIKRKSSSNLLISWRYLKDLCEAFFYNPIRIERDYNDILEEMVRIDYNDHHFLVDFQDNSDEPLF